MPKQSFAAAFGCSLVRLFRLTAATVVALMMALLGAETMAVAVVLLVAGIALDLLRHHRAPDLQRDEAAIVRELAASAADPEAAKAEHARALYRVIVPIYTLPLVYTAFWVFAAPTGDTAQSYLQVFAPIHGVFSTFVEIMRRHTMDLAVHGYLDRALLAAHLYTVYYITFIIATAAFLWSASWRHAHLIAAGEAMLPPDVRLKAIQRAGFYPFLFLCMAITFYAFLAKMRWIDWQPGSRRPYNIHLSNIPFLWTYLISFSMSHSIGDLYARSLMYLYRSQKVMTLTRP
ncbi:hypothetical protein [Azospirillum sp. sgz301742]